MESNTKLKLLQIAIKIEELQPQAKTYIITRYLKQYIHTDNTEFDSVRHLNGRGIENGLNVLYKHNAEWQKEYFRLFQTDTLLPILEELEIHINLFRNDPYREIPQLY